MSYKKLRKEEISVNLQEGKNGELTVIVGMYGKNGWMHWLPIRLINFPETCESIKNFNFTIDGAKTE